MSSNKKSTAHHSSKKNTAHRYDSINDLLERMRFAPSSSGVWFDSERMVMLHAATFGQIRTAIIEQLGSAGARDLLMKIGYARGKEDVEIVSRMSTRNTEADRLFRAGPELMSIMGITGTAPTFKYEMDEDSGAMVLEASSDISVESEIHLNQFGLAEQPVCWFLNGYASGFCTAALGEPFLVKEVACRGTGHQNCKSIGRLLADWPEESLDNEAALFFENPAPAAFDNSTSSGVNPAASESDAKTSSAISISSTDDVTLDQLQERVVGQSASFQIALSLIKRVASTDATALFLGETGVGKEVLANELHRLSKRADKPLIAVNCAALPADLVEAELFGVERGSYTGASRARMGRFERAHGGTLFLDEVGTLSLAAQAKVLRAIQSGEIERVGDQTTRKVDVRLIGATNVDLAEAVRAGKFRQDLYFRLNVFPITVPPLRERPSDIRPLVDIFVRRFSLRHGRSVRGISVAAMDLIWSYHWPGNVRELENVAERGVVLADEGGLIEARHILFGDEQAENLIMTPDLNGRLAHNSLILDEENLGVGDEILAMLEASAKQRKVPLHDLLKNMENRLVDRAVAHASGNLSAAGRELGMTRAQIAYRLAESGVEPPAGE